MAYGKKVLKKISFPYLFLLSLCFSGSQNNRSSPRTRAPTAEGVYNNSHFLHAAAAQVGNNVRVKTKGGVIVEGIFRTFSEDFHVNKKNNKTLPIGSN